MHRPGQTPESPLSLQHPPPSSHATHLPLRGVANPRLSAINDASFDDVDIADSIRPPPSAFTAATAYDPHSCSPVDNYSSPRLGHQRSLTDTFFDNCQPIFDRATSTLQQHTSKASFPSPARSLASFIPSRRTLESTASQPKIRAGAKVLSNFVRSFNGTSSPVNLGITPTASIREDSDTEYDSEDSTMMTGMFNRGPTHKRSATTHDSLLKQSTPTPPKPQNRNNSVSTFGWLLNSQKNAAVPPLPPLPPKFHNPEDELLNLKISAALFPHGALDPLDPSSFHDLLSAAEQLLSRYQIAYRKVSTELADARAEQSAQDDELDEADTRARHLKMQLETMAARAIEQDAEMWKMREELAFERRARSDEQAAPRWSLSPTKDDSPRRRNRVSNSDVSVDSGFESECEIDAASNCSGMDRCISPTHIPSSAAPLDDPQPDTTPKGKQPVLITLHNPFGVAQEESMNIEQGGWGCANCEGGAHSAVWARLASEREENTQLRTRVEVLENAVESALNVVDGPWGI